ncbi:hypothetical protein TrST_g7729 [Triparma strigata]|uniref:Uncharacterized protein n=1 Tax=Triparma strigata TaxID=1606541 RepID=A0A9W6ZVQ9_9STRA|nr:hypothetical protein TrST_g7729 [Triparma strigata]
MDVSPDDIHDAAEQFDIDLHDEPYLVWIMREFCLTPLPPNYSKAINELGEEGFVNDATGQGSTTHPALPFFSTLVKKEREKQAAMAPPALGQSGRTSPSSSPGRTSPIPQGAIQLGDNDKYRHEWMEFTSDRGRYYHNFATDKMTTKLNPNMNIVSAPIVMKQSTNILRKRSEFMPALLRFRSWWQETQSFDGVMDRKEIEVIFDARSDELKIKMINSKDSAAEYRCDNVDSLQFWDFHVGAVINIMGRATTLMQASLETQRWYDIEFKRLSKVREKLKAEVKKYDLVAATSREPPSPTKGTRTRSLRWLVEQCEKSAGRLYELRPAAVGKVIN